MEGRQIPNTILSVDHIIVLLQILLIHFKLLLSISTRYQRLLELTRPIIKLMYTTNLKAMINEGGDWVGLAPGYQCPHVLLQVIVRPGKGKNTCLGRNSSACGYFGSMLTDLVSTLYIEDW